MTVNWICFSKGRSDSGHEHFPPLGGSWSVVSKCFYFIYIEREQKKICILFWHLTWTAAQMLLNIESHIHTFIENKTQLMLMKGKSKHVDWFDDKFTQLKKQSIFFSPRKTDSLLIHLGVLSIEYRQTDKTRHKNCRIRLFWEEQTVWDRINLSGRLYQSL